MNRIFNQSRRDFLTAAALAGGGFAVGFVLPATHRLAAAATGEAAFRPNAFIRITPDDRVTIVVGQSEMGQGVLTALPMIVAEELDADWSRITIEQAPADPAFNNPQRGVQFTGGSSSVRSHWQQLARAGAAARAMLVATAAGQWGVDLTACRTEKGQVVHAGNTASYGQLADGAARQPVPQQVVLKNPGDYRIVGKPMPRLDTREKTDGSGRFGLDVRLPGMLIASVARCPVFGGRVAKYDDSKAKTAPGVKQVVQIDSGVAVIADTYWHARRGRDALVIEWDNGPNAALSSAGISAMFAGKAQQPGSVAAKRGDAAAALAGAGRKVEAVYELPFLAHATMEPMNCTADVRDDGCDVYGGFQAQTFAEQTAMKLTRLPRGKINVHTMLLGGGFGRRFEQDFLSDAVQLSIAAKAPVKVVYSREEDMRHDFYRPATYNRFAGTINEAGEAQAWTHRLVCPSILSRVRPASVKNGIDPTSVEGAFNLPYEFPDMTVDYVIANTPVPVGFWRSVGSSHTAFVTESFIDEMAHAADKDPYEFRRALLAKHPRHKAVLELAAQQGGWGSTLPEGRFRGIALAESFGSIVAEVAQISIGKDGKVRVHHVACVVDCGRHVNPGIIEAQMESGIVYGLTAALYGAITLKDGHAEQGNFNDYLMLRINEMPEIDVHIVNNAEAPGGIGEPGTPPIAPAVCNAIFAATGKRIRKLPVNADDLKRA